MARFIAMFWPFSRISRTQIEGPPGSSVVGGGDVKATGDSDNTQMSILVENWTKWRLYVKGDSNQVVHRGTSDMLHINNSKVGKWFFPLKKNVMFTFVIITSFCIRWKLFLAQHKTFICSVTANTPQCDHSRGRETSSYNQIEKFVFSESLLYQIETSKP